MTLRTSMPRSLVHANLRQRYWLNVRIGQCGLSHLATVNTQSLCTHHAVQYLVGLVRQNQYVIAQEHAQFAPALCLAQEALPQQLPVAQVSGRRRQVQPPAEHGCEDCILRSSELGGTHPWPSQRYCESTLSRSRPSCSRTASLILPRIRWAVRSACSVSVRSSSGSVYWMICLMSNGYRVMRCTVGAVGGGGGETRASLSRRTGHEEVARKVEIAHGGVLPQSLRDPISPAKYVSARANS